jgi:hypothetical protein
MFSLHDVDVGWDCGKNWGTVATWYYKMYNGILSAPFFFSLLSQFGWLTTKQLKNLNSSLKLEMHTKKLWRFFLLKRVWFDQ